MYLLDTCVLSETRKKRPDPKVIDWLSRQDPNLLFLSAISIGEIRNGIASLGQTRKARELSGWLTELEKAFAPRILSVNLTVAECWGETMAAAAKALHPDALLLVHPECNPQISAMADYVGATSGIITYAKKSDAAEFIIGTEISIVMQLQLACPEKRFYPISTRLMLSCAICIPSSCIFAARESISSFHSCLGTPFSVNSTKCCCSFFNQVIEASSGMSSSISEILQSLLPITVSFSLFKSHICMYNGRARINLSELTLSRFTILSTERCTQ